MFNTKSNNSKLLLITPEFRKYGEALSIKYEELGYEVIHLIDCPKSKLFRKAIQFHSIRIKFKFLLGIFEWINCKVLLSKIKYLSFDYVIIIKGNHLTKGFLKRLRYLNPNAKFINYQWDSHRAYQFTLNKDFLENSQYFDKLFSFDMVDCQHIKALKYLPLFYLDDYLKLKEQTEDLEIDCLFIGGLHSNRGQVLTLFYDNLERMGLNCIFIFLDPRKKNNTIRKGIINIQEPLLHSEVVSFVKKAKIIIDTHSNYQNGLTIRTFEALGAGKKLVTSNRMIIQEPFYDPSVIYVFNESAPSIPMEFIHSTAKPIDMSSYSLTEFAKNLL